MFRGVILSGMRSRMGIWPCIVLVGLLFGIFHISVFRIPPIAVLGMVLTYLTVRTGSIYAAMLVHLMNNSFAILLTTEHMPAFVGTVLGLEQFEENGLPTPVFATALVGCAVGVALVEFTTRGKSTAAT